MYNIVTVVVGIPTASRLAYGFLRRFFLKKSLLAYENVSNTICFLYESEMPI